MRKVLIIDDEPIVREGLKSIISWVNYGYDICDVGTDGRDGLSKIRHHQPDLVLIDIRMPGLSGIETIKQIKKEGYPCKFIILSGYSSFSYAKESINLGIASYLLKPIVEEELIRAVEEVSLDMSREESVYDQLSLYKKMTEEQSWKKLLEGRWEDIQSTVLEKFKDRSFQVALFSNEINQAGYHWIVKKIEEDANYIKLITKENHIHLLFIDKQESKVKEFLNETLAKLDVYGNPNCIVMLGCQATGYKNVSLSYQLAKQLINVHFCFSKDRFLTYDMLEGKRPKPTLEENKQVICRYMEFNDIKSLKNELMKLERYYQAACYPKERIKAEMIDFTVSVFRTLKQNHQSIQLNSKEVLVDKILKQGSLQNLIEYIYRELRISSQNINGYTSNKDPVDKIKDYINQYYYEDLNLKLLADIFSYNSSYLGKKFKKQTGEYFHSYLDLVRIDNAKLLLTKGQNKVYEISEQVGYCNIDYFHKKFKKYVGISPKEYQKLYNKVEKAADTI